MKTYQRNLVIVVCALFFVALSFCPALSADVVTIVGTVNDYYQIETDEGEAYDIGDSEQGDELIGHTGAIVKATGTVEEDEDGAKVITVTSFVVIQEASAEDIDVSEEEML